MIAYPAYHRLPAYDPARMELEDKEELDGHSELQDVLEVLFPNVLASYRQIIELIYVQIYYVVRVVFHVLRRTV